MTSRAKLSIGLAGLVPTLALALVVGGRLTDERPDTSVEPQSVPARVADCEMLDAPPLDVEKDTNLDRARHLVTVSLTVDGVNRSVTIDYDDPACLARPELRRLIDHVLATP